MVPTYFVGSRDQSHPSVVVVAAFLFDPERRSDCVGSALWIVCFGAHSFRKPFHTFRDALQWVKL